MFREGRKEYKKGVRLTNSFLNAPNFKKLNFKCPDVQVAYLEPPRSIEVVEVENKRAR